MPRFVPQPVEHIEACTVVDTDASRWSMPERAITMRVRSSAAYKIAGILNQEWEAFLANPN